MEERDRLSPTSYCWQGWRQYLWTFLAQAWNPNLSDKDFFGMIISYFPVSFSVPSLFFAFALPVLSLSSQYTPYVLCLAGSQGLTLYMDSRISGVLFSIPLLPYICISSHFLGRKGGVAGNVVRSRKEKTKSSIVRSCRVSWPFFQLL